MPPSQIDSLTTQISMSNATRLSYGRRQRNGSQASTSLFSASCLSTIAALTFAATYLVSSASGFATSGSRTSLEKAIYPVSGVNHHTALPFGILQEVGRPFGSYTRLFMAPSSGNDKEEWRALLAAFQLYKAAYGDLRVPTRFVVPSMKPWPEAAWDMRLGQKVGQIRSMGKYIDNNEKRRQQLEKLGFVWRLRSETKSAMDSGEIPFEQIFKALEAYRKELQPTGPLTVPMEFTVPEEKPWPESTRGLPLGRSLQMLRSRSYLDENPGAEESLISIGFQLDSKVAANDVRFQNVFDALNRYKEIYGDLFVPQPFEVPTSSNDWPESTWGLRLGARVNAIRSQGTFVKTNPERRELLDNIGFVWSPPESERRKRGRKSKAEKEEESQVLLEAVPNAPAVSVASEEDDLDSFVASFDFSGTDSSEVMPQEDYIAPTWGFEGGSEFTDRVAAAEAEAAEQADRDEYKPPQTLEESLNAARERAVEVGIVQSGVGKTLIKGKREREIPWFNDDFGGEFVFEDVVEALTLYKSFYGDFSNFTTEEFVIPTQYEEPDPFAMDEDEDDMEMIDKDPSARAAAAIARFEELDDLEMTEDSIEAEITRLEDEVLQPEAESVISTLTPLIEVEWPEHLGGMRLGNIVARIRDGSLEVKHLPERKKQLNDIDFDWGDPKYFLDVPFEKAMCAMYAYFLVRGDMFVQTEFLMPDEDPWPQALAGYEIGKAVKRIRELQHFFEAYHTDKVRLLRAIDFVWFPTLALPLDPNEPEMTPETLQLSALGHPDYNKMTEIPMGLPDKLIAEGPFLDTDDPRQWWRKGHNWDYVADYWYQNGRRDNAFVLRGMGYPQMADEHEEKYGIGLFTLIEETLDSLEGEPISDATEKEELFEKLKYYRSELTGCTDLNPKQLEDLVEQLDLHMIELVTGKKGSSAEEELEAVAQQYEEEALAEDGQDYEEEEVNIASEESEEEEYDDNIDLEEELGLDSTEEEQA